MNDPRAVLERMESVRAKTLLHMEDLTQEQLDWRPPPVEGKQEWSLGEILMHLAIDEIYLRELLALLLLESAKLPDAVGYLPPPPPYGALKEVIGFWFERARLQTRRLFGAWPEEARLDLTHEAGMAPMNGLEWFEGYAYHEAFHHEQIAGVLAQLPVS